MTQWKVKAAYDLDRQVWYVKRSNVPGLRIETAGLPDFKAEVARLSRETAGEDYPHTVITTCWTLSSPFIKRAIVNGRLVSTDQAKEIAAQYAETV